MNTDVEWEKWGRQDPYFGVLTDEKYRNANLTEAAKAEFFESGREHVTRILDQCRRYIDPAFAPRTALDFGCGTGRVVVPLAADMDRVVGVDISVSMLAEAADNCRSLNNVELVASDDELSRVKGTFDLVHSYIVFQHIAPDRGLAIFQELLARLAEGGIGVVQFAYAKTYLPDPLGPMPEDHPFRQRLSALKRWLLRRPPAPARDPAMEMNRYDVSRLCLELQQSGIERSHLEFTDHGGELGATFYFQKVA